MLVEVAYGANALGFWPRKAPKWLADEKVRTLQPLRPRPQAWSSATGRVGVVGVIGPWNYPLVNSRRGRHPSARRGQRRRRQAIRGDAAHLAAVRTWAA